MCVLCVSGARFVDVNGSYLSKHTSKNAYLVVYEVCLCVIDIMIGVSLC